MHTPLPRQAVHAELAGPTGRVSHSTLASLARALLSRRPAAQRGYVMEAWPRSVPAARVLFWRAVPQSPEELSRAQVGCMA